MEIQRILMQRFEKNGKEDTIKKEIKNDANLDIDELLKDVVIGDFYIHNNE